MRYMATGASRRHRAGSTRAGDDEADGADRQPHQLPFEEIPGRTELLQADDRRGRQDHDHADQAQDGHQDDEHPVGPAAAGAGTGVGSRRAAAVGRSERRKERASSRVSTGTLLRRVCGSRWRRSGRRGRHRTGTSRSWRIPATAVPRHPDGPAARPRPPPLPCWWRRHTGPGPRRRLPPRRPPRRWRRRRAQAARPHAGRRGRVPCCGRPRSARPTRSRRRRPAPTPGWWPWNRRTNSRRHAHATRVTRCGSGGVEVSPFRHPARVAPAAEATAAAARALARSWGRARGNAETGITVASPGPTSRSSIEVILRLRGEGERHPVDLPRNTAGRGPDGRVVGVEHRGVPRPLVGPDPGLGGPVVVEARMPVEMVRGQVEPAADRWDGKSR